MVRYEGWAVAVVGGAVSMLLGVVVNDVAALLWLANSDHTFAGQWVLCTAQVDGFGVRGANVGAVGAVIYEDKFATLKGNAAMIP